MSSTADQQGLPGREATTAQIEAARAGSVDSLGKLLEACRDYLLLIANAELDTRLSVKGGASDLVQETFLEAHQNFPRFRGQTHAELLAWLRQILLSHLANFRRRFRRTRKRQLSREAPLWNDGSTGTSVGRSIVRGEPSPSWSAVVREERELLEQALTRLSELDRSVILFVHRDRLSFAEAGRRMNRSANSVRGIWMRAIVRLTREVDAVNETD